MFLLYDGFHGLYMDGLKIGDQVPLAAVARNSAKPIRLPDKASIFRAELYAITLAMDFICHSKDTKFIVFSDSKSRLEALNGFKIKLDLVLKIIKDYTSLIKAGKVIEFCWIPSHVNICVLQSSVRWSSCPSSMVTYFCNTASFLVGECL